MENNNNEEVKLPEGLPEKVEIIPEEAIMDIRISGTFYQRIQALFIYLSQKKDPKEFLLHYAYISQGGEPKEEYDFHLYTLMALLLEIEKCAKEKNLTLEKDTVELFKKKPSSDPSEN